MLVETTNAHYILSQGTNMKQIRDWKVAVPKEIKKKIYRKNVILSLGYCKGNYFLKKRKWTQNMITIKSRLYCIYFR